ncbi:MAG TPA: integrase [Paracoccus solventivorans]|uniref:Integrase n=1 Tax=Paracoccus solventivorans TaxID=53463 RepID=A0A832PP45_9RHOB|nr:DUF6538 domain-containing protein [Paracoccus solventivorans]HHW34346.1 integrase [Paracoccus solventivorans]
MAGQVRHLKVKGGRFYARIAVPKDAQTIIGKTELVTPLGGDRREAMRGLSGAVAVMQEQIAAAQGKGSRSKPSPANPLTPDQLGLALYRQRLVMDDQLRDDPRWSNMPLDDHLVAGLRDAVAGRLSDLELAALVGAQIETFRAAGNVSAEIGSAEWRIIARSLAIAELEALGRVAERDEGDFTGKPEHPLITNAAPPEEEVKPVRIDQLWKDYVAARQQIEFMRDGGRRQAPVIESLRKHLGHNDAVKVTRKDLLEWRDKLLITLSAKTVSDIYLSTIRSLFAWAHENERLAENVAATVKQAKPRKVRSREAGYTDAEAVAVLSASRSYQPTPDHTGRIREKPESVRAKQWVPLLAAFSGARVSELTQLRKEDFRQEGGRWVMRITPDAGTVKAGGFRDVPLHPQIIAEGFVAFMEGQGAGPLFHDATDPARHAAAAQRRSNKLAEWLREAELTPAGMQPNHAWRHRFKSKARDIGADPRVTDAIQGHAGKTAGDDYGDVSLIAKARVIDAMPHYKITKP